MTVEQYKAVMITRPQSGDMLEWWRLEDILGIGQTTNASPRRACIHINEF